LLKGGVPVDLFPFFYVCITNNKDLAECVDDARLVEGPAISVLTFARDMIHKGWKLVASPLYGNFKPAQQPYRTLVLSRKIKDEHILADSYSIELIESAMHIFRECEIKRIPGDMPDEIDSDYKYVDFALMEDTLRECGILRCDFHRCIGG
jgi:hypothetical protein